MLTYISIKNLAIINNLELEFHQDLSCLTGETGAGKSIIIDAISLLLGGRADATLIRTGTDRCEILGIFAIEGLNDVLAWLEQYEYSSGNECIIRRIITSDGRSRSSINGYPITQQNLRTLASLLISIQGQHENQNLIHLTTQLELLDAFANNHHLLNDVQSLYQTWLRAKKDLDNLQKLAQDREANAELLQYQLSEFQQLEVSVHYLEALRQEQKYLSSMEGIITNLHSALNQIIEDEEEAALHKLYAAQHYLNNDQTPNSETAHYRMLLDTAIINLEELANGLKSQLNTLEVNPERLNAINEELENLYKIARKHHVELSELAQVKANLEAQIQVLNQINDELEKSQQAVKAAEESYLAKATLLSQARQAAVMQLNQLVTLRMQELAITGGQFFAKLVDNANPIGALGIEHVEFWVTTNPGQPPQPLSLIASGGELSRISLAIQAITATHRVTPTLIFDEIDSGIGGKTANMVGQLLVSLAQTSQILCITHLPQIAAQAEHQILIEKIIEDNQTTLQLRQLNAEERIMELARMLGGVEGTQQSLVHARELLAYHRVKQAAHQH